MASWRFNLDLPPTPCPRPRMTRQGSVYYPGSYSTWKREAAKMLPGVLFDAGLHVPLEVPVMVVVTFIAKQPGRTKLPFPKPDIDNYLKSLFDAMNGLAFLDDWQVQATHATKHKPPMKS